MTLREAAQQALEALIARGKRGDGAPDTIAALRAALEQPEPPWAEIPKEFNDWWDADRLTQTNPFRYDSPAYWAFEGWQARAAVYENDDMFTEAYAGGFSAGAAAEREACAQVADGLWKWNASAREVAAAIRARGEG